MKQKPFIKQESGSQTQPTAPGFLYLAKEQASHPGFRRDLILWVIGAAVYTAVFLLLMSWGGRGLLYPASAAAGIGYFLCMLPGMIKRNQTWLGGQLLGRNETLSLNFIRLGASVGGALIAGYYLVGRMGMDFLPSALITAAALLAGHAVMSFLSYPILLYIIFGLLTTVVSVVSFNGINYLLYGTVTGGGGEFGWVLPKAVSWVLAVLFAFFTNRKLVFNAQGNVWMEMLRFFVARAASGLFVEFLGLFVLENLIGLDRDVSNLITSVIVVVVNYIFSKIFVFTERGNNP